VSFCFHLFDRKFYSFIQTLTALDLEGNNFGSRGAQYLANALPYITVSLTLTLNLYCILFHFLTQTLTTLNLSLNQIWNEGVRFIADALPNNTVTLFFVSFIYVHF